MVLFVAVVAMFVALVAVVAVVAFPLRLAVIVPAEKFPDESLSTRVLGVLALVYASDERTLLPLVTTASLAVRPERVNPTAERVPVPLVVKSGSAATIPLEL